MWMMIQMFVASDVNMTRENLSVFPVQLNYSHNSLFYVCKYTLFLRLALNIQDSVLDQSSIPWSGFHIADTPPAPRYPRIS